MAEEFGILKPKKTPPYMLSVTYYCGPPPFLLSNTAQSNGNGPVYYSVCF